MIQATTYIEDSNIDCFVVTESWLKESLDDNQVAINNYNISRLDRDLTAPDAKTKGGGLLIYTATNVCVKHFPDCNISNRDIELMYIQINKGNYKTLNIISVYRPPDGKLEVFLEKLTALILKINGKTDTELFVLGDFNVDVSRKSNDRDKLETLQNQLGLKQLIRSHTHINPKGKDSTIDLILTNSNHIVESGVSYISISDHHPIYVTRDHIPVKRVPLSFTGRSYKFYIEDNFTTGLKNVNWNEFWDCEDPSLAWDMFINRISFLLDFTCPVKTFNIKQAKKPWVDRDLLFLFKEKDEAMKKYRKTGDEDDGNIAHFLQNYAKSEGRKAKNKWNRRKLAEHHDDPKKYWKCIGDLVNPKTHDPVFNLVDQNNGEHIKNVDTADFINTYFATIGDKLASNMDLPYVSQGQQIIDAFSFIPCEIEEIKKLVKNIDRSKSSGVPNISTMALKDAFKTLPYHLLKIVNLVLETGRFPDAWKQAIVTPLPKGGGTNLMLIT